MSVITASGNNNTDGYWGLVQKYANSPVAVSVSGSDPRAKMLIYVTVLIAAGLEWACTICPEGTEEKTVWATKSGYEAIACVPECPEGTQLKQIKPYILATENFICVPVAKEPIDAGFQNDDGGGTTPIEIEKEDASYDAGTPVQDSGVACPEKDKDIECACDPDGNGIITDRFKDQNLLAAVRKALGKGANEDITLQDALSTTYLGLDHSNISDLSGLECFIGLTNLDLNGNQISNISPLAKLVNLVGLFIGENQISNISPLAELKNLATLGINRNPITDLSSLAKLTNLNNLNFGNCQVKDLSPLAGLVNMEALTFGANQIVDLSPLAALIKLRVLLFYENRITDVTVLANFKKLTDIQAFGNQIVDITSCADLTELNYLDFSVNQIKDIQPLIKNAQNGGLGTGDKVILWNNPIANEAQISELRNYGVDVNY